MLGFFGKQKKTGKNFYALLDDGTDFNGIFIYMQLDEDEQNISMWDNISYAIAATAKEAYLFENQKQLSSPLGNVDSSILDLFIENLKEINTVFYEHVEEIKDFVSNGHSPSKNNAIKELENLGLIK